MVAQPWVEREFGIFLPITPPTATSWLYLAVVLVASLLLGLAPAWKAYRNALSDGLRIRLGMGFDFRL